MNRGRLARWWLERERRVERRMNVVENAIIAKGAHMEDWMLEAVHGSEALRWGITAIFLMSLGVTSVFGYLHYLAWRK